jgi:hypothetical protein
MYKPSLYLVITYFPTYLHIYETYFLQNWLPRWNQILTQLRFIHIWVITGIQWMVHWWVLVHCGRSGDFAMLKLMLLHKQTCLHLGVGRVLAGAHKDAPRAEFWASSTGLWSPARVNQHPPSNHARWMVCGQEALFHCIPIP